MSPDPTRRSGEHRANGSGEYVTQSQFVAFVDDFRDFAGKIVNRLDDMKDKMALGNARFGGIERDIDEVRTEMNHVVDRSDEHSGRVSKLEEDKKIDDALRVQAAENARPKKNILESLAKTLVTALVLGALALGYNAWRDAALDERQKERDAATLKSQPTTPKPASSAP